MSKPKIIRTIAVCIISLILLFVLLFYVVPIYNIKTRGTVITSITTPIEMKDPDELKQVLYSRNNMKFVEKDTLAKFIQLIISNEHNKVVSEFNSSDDIVISVVNDDSEARLVLSQKGLFSKWTLVNIRFLEE